MTENWHCFVCLTLEIQSMKRSVLSFILIGFCVFFALNGQGRNKKLLYFERGLEQYQKGDFEGALPFFNQLIRIDSTYTEAYLFKGLCLLSSSDQPAAALASFERGLYWYERGAVDTDLYYDLMSARGEALQVLMRMDEAVEVYRQLESSLMDSASRSEVRLMWDRALANRFSMTHSIPAVVRNLSRPVNSTRDDHLGCLNLEGNKLYFTSKRNLPKDSTGFYERMYVSELKDSVWQTPVAFAAFPSESGHESMLSLSADGKTMFVFRGRDGQRQIYQLQLHKSERSKPVLMPSPVNSAHNQTHASLSADKTALFFTSDRPGGYGGLDIYVSKLGADGKWGNPRNLGSQINTPRDEETPFMQANGHTLYFASEGHSGMGRMDVYFTEMLPDSSFTRASNMGYPINTVEDDFGFWPDVANQKAILASTRQMDKIGGCDLFEVTLPSSAASGIAVIRANASDSTGIARQVLIRRDVDGLLVGDYRPAQPEGQYALFLETGYGYAIEEQYLTSHKRVKEIYLPDSLSYAALGEQVSLEVAQAAMLAHEERLEQKSRAMPLEAATVKQEVVLPAEPNYVVQVLALKRKPLYASAYLQQLTGYPIETMKCTDGFVRYLYGGFGQLKEGNKALKEIQKTGQYRDAFVRAYSGVKKLCEPKN